MIKTSPKKTKETKKICLPENLWPQVIKDTKDYLVINKPAGLTVHGGAGIKEATLIDWLVKKYPPLKKVGDDPLRPGIVHRLDKEVSGLMVIAKTPASFLSLKDQFKNRQIIKEYIALVYGQIAKDEGEINFPIRRAQSGYKMAALPIMDKGLIEKTRLSGRDSGTNDALLNSRAALSLFKVLKKYINYTLLQVRIKTGRTHQIRVHFAAYGHPLVGDNLYSTKKTRVKNKKINLGRIFLFSKHLAFSDLKGLDQEFELELDQDLKTFLNDKVR